MCVNHPVVQRLKIIYFLMNPMGHNPHGSQRTEYGSNYWCFYSYMTKDVAISESVVVILGGPLGNPGFFTSCSTEHEENINDFVVSIVPADSLGLSVSGDWTSVHENHRTCQTFPMARRKCLIRDFTKLNRTYTAHQTNIWWTMKVFRLHCWTSAGVMMTEFESRLYIGQNWYLKG